MAKCVWFNPQNGTFSNSWDESEFSAEESRKDDKQISS